MEVMHGDIRLTLSDADAIRGVQRTRAAVKRGLREIDRQKAVVTVEADIKDLDKKLVKARRDLRKFQGLQAEAEIKGDNTDFSAKIEDAVLRIKKFDGKKAKAEIKLEGQRQAIKELHDLERELEKTRLLEQKLADASRKAADDEQKAAATRIRAERAMQADLSNRTKLIQDAGRAQLQARREFERDMNARGTAMEKARMDAISQRAEVAKLQQEYMKAAQAADRLARRRNTIGGKVREAVDPDVSQRVHVQQARAIGEMEILRAKLEAMGEKPIEINTHVSEGGNALAKLADLGNIGTRIGPFSGTLAQFTKAALVLGPILTGLLGTVGAFTAAVGTGVAGAAGIGGSALLGFGLTLGGTFALMKSGLRDFKNLNTLQNAYHVQVLKTGEGSDKAKKKLKEFNHALGVVPDTTREAFLTLDKLQDRWRALSKEARPDIFNALGEGIRTVNGDFDVFGRNTLRATKAVSQGFQGWMKGLRTRGARDAIGDLMKNTTDAIPPLMEGLGHLGAAIGRVGVAFSSHFPDLARQFSAWTGGLDEASTHTDNLNRTVDSMVESFKNVITFAGAAGNVIKELMAAGTGSGNNLLLDMSKGLNDMARNLHNNRGEVAGFFQESVDTVERLYNTLKPLVALFWEFSTLLRPMTNIVLSVSGAVASLVNSMAAFGPLRLLFQVGLGAWFLRRTTAGLIGTTAEAVRGLTTAMRGLAGASAMGGLSKVGAGLASLRTGGAAAGTASRVGTAAQVGATGMLPGVGRANPAGAAATAYADAGRLRKAGMAADGLSTALLGVSAPVAGIGIAAAGAVYGIKKFADAANDRARDLHNVAPNTHPNKTAGVPLMRGPGGAPSTGGGIPLVNEGAKWFEHHILGVKDVEKAEQQAAQHIARDLNHVNDLYRERGEITRTLSDQYSQVASAEQRVHDAQKQANATAKKGGTDHLVALQQLHDAQRDLTEATDAWNQSSRRGYIDSNKAVQTLTKDLKTAQDLHWDPRDIDRFRRALDQAKNSAAGFQVNLQRSKAGTTELTGKQADTVGQFARTHGQDKGFQKLVVQVEDRDAVSKIANIGNKLQSLGRGHTVTKILANSGDADTAIQRLNTMLHRYENRNAITRLKADKADAQDKLADINKKLSRYGERKPQALLRAKDEAKEKIDALNRQLDRLDKRTIKTRVEMSIKLNADMESAGGALRPGPRGDGTGVPDVEGAVKGKAKSYAKTHRESIINEVMLGAGGLGKAQVAGAGLNAFNALATKFGLTIGSGQRDGSITASGNLSYHAMGRARDFPGPPAQMLKFARFMAATFGSRLKELIHTPLGYGIKDGHRVPLSFWGPKINAMHGNHVHVAMATGGRVAPTSNPDVRSGRYTSPTVLFSEEPRRPEYFISTNPRDRKRSQSLVVQAASEVGLQTRDLATTTAKFATGGFRGPSNAGFSINTKKPNRAQLALLTTAMQIAQSLGAGPKATKALISALIAESSAKNLKGGDASSSGPLQLLASTAKNLGVSARDTHAVIKLFLTKGFTGKGGAIELAKNKRLTSAQVAAMVQGNRDGASTYARFGGEAGNVMRAWKQGGGTSAGGADTGEVPTTGHSRDIANRIAESQAALARAEGTTDMPLDDVLAIRGSSYTRRRSQAERNITRRERMATRLARYDHALDQAHKAPKGSDAAKRWKAKADDLRKDPYVQVARLDRRYRDAEKAKNTEKAAALKAQRDRKFTRLSGGPATVTRRAPGLIERLSEQQSEQVARLRKVDKALRPGGKLTPTTRTRLLEERAGLVTGIEENRTKRRDLAKQADEAAFEFSRGAGKGRADIDLKTAQAASTSTLDDDLVAAQAEQNYYAERAKWATKRNDKAGSTEAINAYNAATEKVKQIQEQAAADFMGAQDARAGLTKGLDDDLAASQYAEKYARGQYDLAVTAGDNAGIAKWGGQLKSAIDNTASIKDQMAQNLIGARDAQASLTDGLDDDLAAAKFAEDYYAEQYNLAVAAGDTEGIAKMGQAYKSATDRTKDVTEQIKMQPLQMASVAAALTNDLNDDVTAAQAMVAYYSDLYNNSTGQVKIDAGGQLASARGALKDAQQNADLLPIERDRALAALTETTDDDKAVTERLRAFWQDRLDAATREGDIAGQTTAAQNLKSVNDEIKQGEESVTQQMMALNSARQDLYSSFGSNFIPTIEPGLSHPMVNGQFATAAPAGPSVTNVNVVNHFSEPPPDPHTWSAGVGWEMQAVV